MRIARGRRARSISPTASVNEKKCCDNVTCLEKRESDHNRSSSPQNAAIHLRAANSKARVRARAVALYMRRTAMTSLILALVRCKG
jgi:hypothetical protein